LCNKIAYWLIKVNRQRPAERITWNTFDQRDFIILLVS